MINNTISYHKATSQDIETIVENRLKFAIELNGDQSEDAKENLKTLMRDYFTRSMPDNLCISFIAKSGDEIAGIGSVVFRETMGGFRNPTGKWGYIMNMYTIPKFRKQGICGRILEMLVEEGRALGVIAFELHATPQGEPVYLKGGFKIHDEPTLRKFFVPTVVNRLK
ncbi:MAG: GNAT family N-acetyltransferase [Bacteroidia bacterium]|nr:GNAT family N-acetyltransferase [Bacteroidia bacterium]